MPELAVIPLAAESAGYLIGRWLVVAAFAALAFVAFRAARRAQTERRRLWLYTAGWVLVLLFVIDLFHNR
jgi:uncharacterized membrane protein SirB2